APCRGAGHGDVGSIRRRALPRRPVSRVLGAARRPAHRHHAQPAFHPDGVAVRGRLRLDAGGRRSVRGLQLVLAALAKRGWPPYLVFGSRAKQTRFRPARLASYMAASADAMNAWVSSILRAAATPTLTVTGMVLPPCWKRWPSTALRSR